jgi:hypothetical protein
MGIPRVSQPARPLVISWVQSAPWESAVRFARGLFGEGASGARPSVEGHQPEPAASVPGCGPGRHGPRLGGEDRRDGPPDAARLGPSLQRRWARRPRRQLEGGSQASSFGGATGSVRADRRGGSPPVAARHRSPGCAARAEDRRTRA